MPFQMILSAADSLNSFEFTTVGSVSVLGGAMGVKKHLLFAMAGTLVRIRQRERGIVDSLRDSALRHLLEFGHWGTQNFTHHQTLTLSLFSVPWGLTLCPSVYSFSCFFLKSQPRSRPQRETLGKKLDPRVSLGPECSEHRVRGLSPFLWKEASHHWVGGPLFLSLLAPMWLHWIG